MTVPSEVHSICQVNRDVGTLPREETLAERAAA